MVLSYLDLKSIPTRAKRRFTPFKKLKMVVRAHIYFLMGHPHLKGRPIYFLWPGPYPSFFRKSEKREEEQLGRGLAWLTFSGGFFSLCPRPVRSAPSPHRRPRRRPHVAPSPSAEARVWVAVFPFRLLHRQRDCPPYRHPHSAESARSIAHSSPSTFRASLSLVGSSPFRRYFS